MKHRKHASLWLVLLLTLSLILCGCGQTETQQTEPTQIPTETVPAQTEFEETVEVTTDTQTHDDGTVTETVTTVEKLQDRERTTVVVTTSCIDGTVLEDTSITQIHQDGSTYFESRNAVQYPEGGMNVVIEIQISNADMTFCQVEEFITQSPDGSSYSERTEIAIDAEGNTTITNSFTQIDEAGNETREETVTVTDAEGNIVE